MKFSKLITEVDFELLEWLWEHGYPIDRIERMERFTIKHRLCYARI